MKFAVAASMLAASASASTAAVDAQLPSFLEFVSKFNKQYEGESEFANRFEIFKQNLDIIAARNAADPNATHGINRFSDLSPAEFAATHLNYVPPTLGHKEVRNQAKFTAAELEADLTSVDWRGSSILTAVKDQGYCGSCWAFSATEQIETDYAISTGELLSLAPQQITSCDSSSYGCNGGWTENAYDYVVSAGGIELESDYPYTSGSFGVTGTCKSDSSDFAAKISGYSTISSRSSQESNMAVQIQSSPMSICVDANTWSSYTGGVVSSCGTSVDHCVQVVGLNADASTPYWIVRNSWGTSWGEDGYIYLAYGDNTCAIASDATVATI